MTMSEFQQSQSESPAAKPTGTNPPAKAKPKTQAKPQSPSPQIDPRNIIKIDPGTLLMIVVALLFLPLLLAGLFSH
jgi:hypothetical protein